MARLGRGGNAAKMAAAGTLGPFSGHSVARGGHPTLALVLIFFESAQRASDKGCKQVESVGTISGVRAIVTSVVSSPSVRIEWCRGRKSANVR